ncbi:MAG: siphovirus Gp157 family protein [Oscillospiraceae bacterium]|nr:siphovirus Gp157 family protein [Oscillospiraceae bacterium]
MIYPISEQLERLMESFADPETGEISVSEEEMQAAVEQLQMDFEEKIVELRNAYINRAAEAAAIKAEKMKLAERQARAEKASERLKRWLAHLLQGERFEKDAVRISYRRSDEVVVEEGFVDWAKDNFPSLLHYRAPEPSKTDIKMALKAGLSVDHAHLETRNHIQVK